MGGSTGTELVSVQEGECECRQAELQGQAHLDHMLGRMHVDLLCQQALTQHSAGSLRKLDVAI